MAVVEVSELIKEEAVVQLPEILVGGNRKEK